MHDCAEGKETTPNADELVRFIRGEKGVTFDLVDEGRAAGFLAQKNFFFKVKAFAKNYPKYVSGPHKGEYSGLDFGHLVELTGLDRELRALVLEVTLDIEHFLKVRINAAAMACEADPFALSEWFQDGVARQVLSD